LNSGKEEPETDDPGPLSDVAGDADDCEVSEKGDDIKNQTDEPGDLLRSFSCAS
jgi:hypothetical protein